LHSQNILDDNTDDTCCLQTMESESKTGPALGEKKYIDASPDGADRESLANGENTLHRSLKGRHMQMIAM
jgi:amino acid permease